MPFVPLCPPAEPGIAAGDSSWMGAAARAGCSGRPEGVRRETRAGNIDFESLPALGESGMNHIMDSPKRGRIVKSNIARVQQIEGSR